MIDKSAFHKTLGSLIYTILRPITEEPQHSVLAHDVAAHLGKLVKLMNRISSSKVDPTKVEWKDTIDQLDNALKPGGVCKDETIRTQALAELKAVKAFFKEATAKPKEAIVNNTVSNKPKP